MSLELILAVKSYLDLINSVISLRLWLGQMIRLKISNGKSKWQRFLALFNPPTQFPYLRKVWQKNTEEERLLGVSLTGIMDNPLTTAVNSNLEKTLDDLRNVAVATNHEYADLLGIPQSAAITCVKPSGTVSQVGGQCQWYTCSSLSILHPYCTR